MARILTIMGSGETAPTMVKVHRSVLERVGPAPVPAVLLDTPFGFQENATELAQRVVHYFAESLRAEIEVASTTLSALEGASRPINTSDDPFANERLVTKLRSARYIFAGPGSPSYALRKWTSTVIPSLLKETLMHGGAVTFSSAAALTLGVRTVPVYEVYKVGEDPFWLEGLDIFGVTGMSAAVIPHYNNAEGGTHDTRYCYLGERRLAMLEPELPEGSFVLGVDEHTAIVLDLEAREGQIAGNGLVTVRAAGRSRTWAAGETVGFDDLAEAAEALRRGRTASGGSRTDGAGHSGTERHDGVDGTGADGGDALDVGGDGSDALDAEPDSSLSGDGDKVGNYAGSPLLDSVREKEASFAEAIRAGDAQAAVQVVLELEEEVTAWSHDIPSGDAMNRARASLRSLILELGRVGEQGLRDPRELLGPFVEAMLAMRQEARKDRRFSDADSVRDRLVELGVEVRDTPEGSEWLLAPDGRW